MENVTFGERGASGDFECLSIREELISLWRKRGSDLGGGPEGVWSRERRRWGAEVGSGGRERRSGAEVGSGGWERRRGSGGEGAEER